MGQELAWADKPLSLVPSPRFQGKTENKHFIANEMAVAHNIYIRGLNAIYQQAEYVSSPADRTDFLLFCRIWTEILEHHHTLEEEIFFPQLENALRMEGLMKQNVDQHRAFHDGIQSFEEYIRTATGESYDAKEIKRQIEKFGPLLVLHLQDEIGTLLDLDQHDPDGSIAKKSFKAFEDRLVAQSSSTRHHPFVFGCRDITYENGVNAAWPGVPAVAAWAITHIFSLKYKRVWRFLPSDFYGNPRPLKYAPQ